MDDLTGNYILNLLLSSYLLNGLKQKFPQNMRLSIFPCYKKVLWFVVSQYHSYVEGKTKGTQFSQIVRMQS
jgi:hypothetical protein